MPNFLKRLLFNAPDSDSDSDSDEDSDDNAVDYSRWISELVASIISTAGNSQINELLIFIVGNSEKSGTKELYEALKEAQTVIGKDNKDDKQTSFDRLAKLCEDGTKFRKVLGYGILGNSEFYKKLKPKVCCLRGDQSLIKGDAKTALHHYDGALKLNPNSTKFQLAKCIALFNMGQDQKALEGFEKISTTNDNHIAIPAKIAMAKIYVKLQKYDKAYTCIKAAKKTLVALAHEDYRNLLYILDKKYGAYILNFKIPQPVTILNEGDKAKLDKINRGLKRLHIMAKTANIHKQYVEKIDNRFSTLFAYMKHDYYQGCWLLDNKKYLEAIKFFDLGIDAVARSVKLPLLSTYQDEDADKNLFLAMLYSGRAKACHHHGDTNGAIVSFDFVLKYDPDNANAGEYIENYLRTLPLSIPGDTQKMLVQLLSPKTKEILKKTAPLLFEKITFDRYNARFHVNFPVVFQRQKLAFEQLIDTHYAKGCDLYGRFQYEKAIACFHAVLQVVPNHEGALSKISLSRQKTPKKLDEQVLPQTAQAQKQAADQKDSKYGPAPVDAAGNIYSTATVIASDSDSKKLVLKPDPKPAVTFTQQLTELEQQQTKLQQLLDQQQADDQKSMQGSYDQKDSKYGPAPFDPSVDNTATAAATASGSDSKEIVPIIIEPIPENDPRLIPRAYNPTPDSLELQQKELQAQVEAINRGLQRLRSEVKEENKLVLQKIEAEMQPILDEYVKRQKELAEQQSILGSDSPALKAFYIHLQSLLNSMMIAYRAQASGKIDSSSGASKLISLLGSLLSPISMGITGAAATGVNFFRSRSSRKDAFKQTDALYTTSISEKLFELVARKLTLRYEEQIRQLTVKETFPSWFSANNHESLWHTLTHGTNWGGAHTLAESVSKRILDAMGQCKYDSKEGAEKWVEQWMDAVFTSKRKHGFGGEHAITDGTIETQDPTKSWSAGNILFGSGIKFLDKNGKLVYYVNLQSAATDYCKEAKASRVGFRWAKDSDEATRLKLKPSDSKGNVIPALTKDTVPVRGTVGVLVDALGQTQKMSRDQKEFIDLQLRRVQVTATKHDAELSTATAKVTALETALTGEKEKSKAALAAAEKRFSALEQQVQMLLQQRPTTTAQQVTQLGSPVFGRDQKYELPTAVATSSPQQHALPAAGVTVTNRVALHLS